MYYAICSKTSKKVVRTLKEPVKEDSNWISIPIANNHPIATENAKEKYQLNDEMDDVELSGKKTKPELQDSYSATYKQLLDDDGFSGDIYNLEEIEKHLSAKYAKATLLTQKVDRLNISQKIYTYYHELKK